MARTDPRNRSRYWNDDTLEGVSCLHADFTAHAYAPHSHDGFVVAATEAGGAEFTSRGTVGEAAPSVLLVFNPAEPHAGRMGRSQRWRYRSVYLSEAAVGEVIRALGIEAPRYFLTNTITDAGLIDAFLALHQALDGDRDVLRRRELMVGVFGRLFGRHGSGGAAIPSAPRDRDRLRRVVEVMQARYVESLSLEDLGAEVGLTPFQLIGLFKRGTGLTPHAYLVQLRLRAAMSRLRAGMPIAEAAASAGFYDQSALTRHLKQCHGVTPLQFARAGRNFGQ